MKIKSVSFVKSSQKWQDCPEPNLPEYAFIGRSNVGKSSLINALMNQKDLAKTSQTPGKTQLINHFKIDDRWFLVDLPGYGYARVSKTTKQVFQRFITDYFEQREQLVSAFVLVDIRHEPQKIDVEFMQWLGERAIPFAIIFTKVDKLKPQAIERNVAAYKEALLEWWEEFPPYFVTSAQNKTGKEELTQYIEQTNQTIING